MDIHTRPITERIEWLFQIARDHSARFSSPEAYLARQRYQARHPTAIIVFKCMDGRINIPIATRIPKGIIQPFRNLGGMFDMGWPHLGEVISHSVLDVARQGRRVLMLITYHFSKGCPERGCAGFDYDTGAAQRHTETIRQQMEHVFGLDHATVYPLVCGFETDEDALILHGQDGQQLNVAELAEGDLDGLAHRLCELYPDMHRQMRDDLIPLIKGNFEHVAEVRTTERELNIEHREWIICVGRGFDFLHMPNLALIIGPYSPNLADPVRKAAGIIRANMEAGRIPDDGFLLLASSPYQHIGVDRARTELKARFLSQFSAEVIRQAQPELAERMHIRTALMNGESRELTLIGTGDA